MASLQRVVLKPFCLSAILAVFSVFPCFGKVHWDLELLENQFLKFPSAQKSREYLKYITSVPHMSGTEGDRLTAHYVLEKFKEFGLHTELQAFKALVAYPVESSLKIVAPTGAQYVADLTEDIVPDGDTSNTWFRNHPFNGYSPSGRVSGELVYVNYGTLEDFNLLTQNLSISLAGKIALVRYGKNYRGIKVYNAQKHGMIGCIIYSDPFDDGFVKGKVYPEGPWRPESGIQRGSVDTGSYCTGDPGFVERDPNICGMSQDQILPQIPALPMSYRDAIHFLSHLESNPAPSAWIGGLNITYNIGPGPVIVDMYVNNSFEVKELWNVIGEIKGEEIADELILVGNHRDAWVFGAADPNSGTAAMLDMARSYHELAKLGWKPKRTIKFCSWDGEEQNLIGSVYFGESLADELTRRAVVYLNVDTAVGGTQLNVALTPSLNSFFANVTKKLQTPENVSLYDSWSKKVDILGAGSDYTVFLDHLGIASADFSFQNRYGVYHSIYDSFHWMDTVGDPGFAYHKLTTELLGLMALRFSEADILPFNYTETSKFLYFAVDQVSSIAATVGLQNDFSSLRASIAFLESVSETIPEVAQLSLSCKKGSHLLNFGLYQAERRFLQSEGVPGRKWFKHVVQTPGLDQGYGADVFASITDALRARNTSLADQQTLRITGLIHDVGSYLQATVESCKMVCQKETVLTEY